MAYLRFDNKIITTPIEEILSKVRADTGFRYLHDIKVSNSGLKITCPFHGDGKEKNPDCFVNIEPNSNLYGVFHCFACGAKGFITDIINFCFNENGKFAENWLIENFANVFVDVQEVLPEIKLDNKEEHRFLPETEIDKYRYFHPYMFQRKLTEDVIRKFSVGYDVRDDSIVFPVWDEKGNLLFFTKRSVKGKNFFIPNGVIKPIYLLNYIVKEHITSVVVCESQINALTAWSWGYPAIALFGTGSKDQYEILKRSGIRNYTLCFDGDEAGDLGIQRFIKNMNDDVLINIKPMPRGKDLNNLTKEEFEAIKLVDIYNK